MNQYKKSGARQGKKCHICQTKQTFIFDYQKFQYYRCPKCAHVSTYPLPTQAIIERHYSSRFKTGNYLQLRTYAKDYLSVYQYFVTVIEQRLKKRNQSLKNKRVLDVGCFTGGFLTLMEKKGADVNGLELQDEAVEIANKELGGRVFKADVTTYTFPQKKYDIISLLGLIEHVPYPMDLLNRSYQLLKKGGILIIQTPNSSSFLARKMQKFWPPYSPVEHIHLFSRESLESALAESGFTDFEFESHWKKLPIGYVYNMFNNFGPEFHLLLKPFDPILRKSRLILPFYVGEMIVTASKK